MFRKHQVVRLALADAEWQIARAGREYIECRGDPAVRRASAVVSAVLRNASLQERQAYAEAELDRLLGPAWRNGAAAEPPEPPEPEI
jgi:hypothetical protein